MKVPRFFVVVPLLTASLWAAPPAASDLPLPERMLPWLDNILKTAVQQSPRMLSRALDLEIAEANRIQARAGLLPSVSAYYSYFKSRDSTEYLYPNPGSNTTNSYSLTKTPYSATLSQPVFYWGERRNTNQIGEIQQKIATGQYRDGYRQLVQELRGGYMRLIVQKLAVKRTGYNLGFTTKQMQQQEERWAKKVISEVEVVAARLTVEQAQIAADRTDFDYQNAKLSFARLAGLGAIADEGIPDSIPATAHVLGPYDQLLVGFLAQKDPPTAEALALRYQLKIENLNYANAKTRQRPKVYASFGLTQDEQHNLYGQGLDYSVSSYYGGLSVSWNIFDGFSSRAVVRSALARRQQLENDYRQLTERLAQDAQTQVRLIDFSARNMSIYDRLLNKGETNLTAIKEQFRDGIRSESDVSLAQINLYDAQLSALNARIDYLLRIGDFLGTVMEDPVVSNLSAK